jgi:hypothetical protein
MEWNWNIAYAVTIFQLADSGYYGLLAFTVSIGLAAFATTSLRTHALPCGSEFKHDSRFLVLSDDAEKLTHDNAGRIIAAQIRLCRRYNLKTLLAEVCDKRFLHHQIPGQPIELFYQNRFYTN